MTSSNFIGSFFCQTCSYLSCLSLVSFLSAAEFVIYKLKEMGKIDQEDVSIVMESFKRYDADQSGTLTESDLMKSQPS